MKNIDDLIGKHLTSEISPSEAVFLKKWRAESSENQAYFEQLERLWQLAPRVEKQLSKPLDLEAALAKTKAKIAFQNDGKSRAAAPKKGRIIGLKTWHFAAAAAIVLLVAAVAFFQKTEAPKMVEFVAADQIRRDTMGDGSVISMNRFSKIEAHFSSKKRRVVLRGEAFFEVAPDAKKPFVVEVENLEITAVGTAFNIFETEKNEVIVRMAEGKTQLKSAGQTVFLVAGEQAIFDRKTGRISTSKMAERSAADGWRTRQFEFDEMPLAEVLPMLEKAYGVRISLKTNALRNCKLRTRFSDEPLEQVLEVLAETFSLTIERVGNGYFLDGAGCD